MSVTKAGKVPTHSKFLYFSVLNKRDNAEKMSCVAPCRNHIVSAVVADTCLVEAPAGRILDVKNEWKLYLWLVLWCSGVLDVPI